MLSHAEVKAHLHDHLRWTRKALVWKLEGLPDEVLRLPRTGTGTNLLGLVKHVATWDARYLGEVFGRPYSAPLPRWDDEATRGTDHRALRTEDTATILAFASSAWAHADSTIEALELSAVGFVPWWNEEVTLFTVMVHCLSDATRHAGHADILREGIDGATGTGPPSVDHT